MSWTLLDSPLGPLSVRESERGLAAVRFGRHPEATTSPSDAAQQLSEYFAGTRREFDLELAPEGTEHDLRVWAELRRIPHGTTISYGELARRLGNPGAARAVGHANGRNPIAIVVPCHRVIASDGTLGGYAGGLAIKRALLELEGAPSAVQPSLPLGTRPAALR